MAFKMKYSGGTPFHFHGGDPAEHDKEIDPTKLKYTTTETATNLAGEQIPVAGTATVTIDPTRKVEKESVSNEAYIKSFESEYEKAKKGGYPGTLPEYITEKETILGYRPKEIKVTRKRNYDQGVRLYPNPFKGMSDYKGIVLERNITESDSLPQATITRAFKTAKDPEGFRMYLDKYGYKLRRGKPKKEESESLSKYKYVINE